MRNPQYVYPEREDKLIGWVALALICGAILAVGFMNGHQLRDCEAKGNSKEACMSAVNP